MGNTLRLGQIVSDEPLLKEYKTATLEDFYYAKENFETLQTTLGDKMTVTPEEFDDVFSLICQDSVEHFALFDSWEVGKVDVREVFAVLIVYCDATIEEKIPLLFDLFDFDQSKTMSQDELVLLMLCTTRALCKVVGLPRPATDRLESFATDAFSYPNNCEQSARISLDNFTKWILHEHNALAYLEKFANTRVIYDNQVQYDLMLNELCTAFLNFAEKDATDNDKSDKFCSELFCQEMIERYCPRTEKHEVALLLGIMKNIMKKNGTELKANQLDTVTVTASIISMDTFFLVISPYAAFLAAGDNEEYSITIEELKILIWLLRGSEPTQTVVDSFMNSFKLDGSLSAMEWVSYALETDKQTGSQSFVNQLHLFFVTSNQNGDAVLSLSELQAGLASLFAHHLKIPIQLEAPASPESAWEELTASERPYKSHCASITSLVAELAKEIVHELEATDCQCIEWYEFRQYLDYLEQRVMETKTYIQEHLSS